MALNANKFELLRYGICQQRHTKMLMLMLGTNLALIPLLKKMLISCDLSITLSGNATLNLSGSSPKRNFLFSTVSICIQNFIKIQLYLSEIFCQPYCNIDFDCDLDLTKNKLFLGLEYMYTHNFFQIHL